MSTSNNHTPAYRERERCSTGKRDGCTRRRTHGWHRQFAERKNVDVLSLKKNSLMSLSIQLQHYNTWLLMQALSLFRDGSCLKCAHTAVKLTSRSYVCYVGELKLRKEIQTTHSFNVHVCMCACCVSVGLYV